MNIYIILKILLLLFVSIGLASTASAANTWTCNEFTWNSLEGDHYSKFTCNVGDKIELTQTIPDDYSPSKLVVFQYAYWDTDLFKDLTPGGRPIFRSGTYEAVNAGNYKLWEWEMSADASGRDILYEITVLDKPLDVVNSTVVVPEGVQVYEESIIHGEVNCQFPTSCMLDVVIGDESYKVKPNSSGYWSVNYTSEEAGEFPVVVSLKNHGSYNDFTNSSVLIVEDDRDPVNSTIDAPEEAAVGHGTIISGVLSKTYNNHGVGGVTLDLTIDNKTYKVETDYLGQWSMYFIPKKEGEQKIKVSLKKHKIYKDFTNTTKIQIKINK